MFFMCRTPWGPVHGACGAYISTFQRLCVFPSLYLFVCLFVGVFEVTLVDCTEILITRCYICTLTDRYTRTHTHTNTHTHTHKHTYTHVHTHTHANIRTHAHMCTHTHTHTHTQTCRSLGGETTPCDLYC